LARATQESVATLIQANKDEIAAIVEPVGNMGCIPPNKGFLQGLRQMCTDNGILLIFDEVMTDSDCQRGVQELLNVTSDIVCFGNRWRITCCFCCTC
jgi:glutamate-1-semialdehyde 2,1-aminomutase